MTAKHTPGPWCVSRRGRRGLPHIMSEAGLYVMDAKPRGVSGGGTVRQMADATLIAAAPDLLTLARQYASECGGCGGVRYVEADGVMTERQCDECADIWAVIDKAEGRA
jgi:hypothetical protein